MAQYIYSMGALIGILLFSMMMNQGRMLSQRENFVNETSTQMMGIADEILDKIDRSDILFDSKTAGQRVWQAKVDSLTQPNGFGGCSTITSCKDIDDFDGLTLTLQNQGMNYDVSVSVDYVSRSNPDSVVATPTFSKRVSVTVTAASVLVGHSSPSTTISRVIPYR